MSNEVFWENDGGEMAGYLQYHFVELASNSMKAHSVSRETQWHRKLEVWFILIHTKIRRSVSQAVRICNQDRAGSWLRFHIWLCVVWFRKDIKMLGGIFQFYSKRCMREFPQGIWVIRDPAVKLDILVPPSRYVYYYYFLKRQDIPLQVLLLATNSGKSLWYSTTDTQSTARHPPLEPCQRSILDSIVDSKVIPGWESPLACVSSLQ